MALGSILNNGTIIKSKLFNFIVNQFTIPSLKKHVVVRPKNRFGKPNPEISAHEMFLNSNTGVSAAHLL
jgi:hypothetical protein